MPCPSPGLTTVDSAHDVTIAAIPIPASSMVNLHTKLSSDLFNENRARPHGPAPLHFQLPASCARNRMIGYRFNAVRYQLALILPSSHTVREAADPPLQSTSAAPVCPLFHSLSSQVLRCPFGSPSDMSMVPCDYLSEALVTGSFSRRSSHSFPPFTRLLICLT